jgi:hypothetical protein
VDVGGFWFKASSGKKKNVAPYLKKQASIALYIYVSAMWEVMTRDCPGQKCSALA